jgi:hypothetical protein
MTTVGDLLHVVKVTVDGMPQRRLDGSHGPKLVWLVAVRSGYTFSGRAVQRVHVAGVQANSYNLANGSGL